MTDDVPSGRAGPTCFPDELILLVGLVGVAAVRDGLVGTTVPVEVDLVRKEDAGVEGRGEVALEATVEGGTLEAGVEAAGVEAIEGGGVRGEENSTQMLRNGEQIGQRQTKVDRK